MMYDDMNLHSDSPMTMQALIWFMNKIRDDIETNIEIGKTGKHFYWEYDSPEERLKNVIGLSNESLQMLNKVLSKIEKAQNEKIKSVRKALEEVQ